MADDAAIPEDAPEADAPELDEAPTKPLTNADLEALITGYQSAGAGRDTAFADLVAACLPFVATESQAFFRGRPELAADAVQEFFSNDASFRKSVDSYTPGVASPRTWILNHFRKRSLKLKKKAASDPTALPGDEAFAGVDSADGLYAPEITCVSLRYEQRVLAVLARQIIVEEIQSLRSEKHRRFMELVYIYDHRLTHAEVASIFEMPLGTVDTGIARAQAALGRAIQKRFADTGLAKWAGSDLLSGIHRVDEDASALLPEGLPRTVCFALMSDRTIEEIAAENGVTERAVKDALTEAAAAIIRIQITRAARTKTTRTRTWLDELLSIDGPTMLRLVAEGPTRPQPADMAFRVLQSLARGLPAPGLRPRLETWAGNQPDGFGALAGLLDLDATDLARFLSARIALPESAADRVAGALGIPVEEVRVLDGGDQLASAHAGMRSSSFSAPSPGPGHNHGRPLADLYLRHPAP